jgi:hypothetical protein
VGWFGQDDRGDQTLVGIVRLPRRRVGLKQVLLPFAHRCLIDSKESGYYTALGGWYHTQEFGTARCSVKSDGARVVFGWQ